MKYRLMRDKTCEKPDDQKYTKVTQIAIPHSSKFLSQSYAEKLFTDSDKKKKHLLFTIFVNKSSRIWYLM